MAPPTAAFILRQPVLPPPVPLLPAPPAPYAEPPPYHAHPVAHPIAAIPPPRAPHRPARPVLHLPPAMKSPAQPVSASQPTPRAKPTLICDGHDTTGENRNQPCQFYMTKRRWRCAFCRLYSPYRTHDGYEGKHS